MKPATVVITGGRGFIGRATVQAFRQAGFAAHTLGPSRPGDDSLFHAAYMLEEPVSNLAALLRALQPVAILHLAAAGPDALPDLQRQVTVQFTGRLLEAAKKEAPAALFIYLGSAAEYGESLFLERPLVESDACRPFTPYGQAKHAAALQVLEARRRGLHATVARLFTAVGPGLPRHSVLGNVAFQLNQMGVEENVLQVGRLETFRDYLDVRDVARFLLELSREKGGLPPVVHLCSGEAQKTGDWVEALVEASGKRVVFQTNPTLMHKKDPEKVIGSADLMKRLGLMPGPPDMKRLVCEILAA